MGYFGLESYCMGFRTKQGFRVHEGGRNGRQKKILANVKLNMGYFKAGLANYGLWFTSSLLTILSSTAKNVSVFLNGWKKIQKKYYICDT